MPMVIVPAEAVGRTGHESKAELDADSALIKRLDRMRVEAGHRMGLGDCSALVTNAAHATAMQIAYSVRYGEYLRACDVHGTVRRILASTSTQP